MDILLKNQQYPTGGRERRVTQTLLAYWNILRADRKFPSRNDVRPDEIPDEWPDTFIVEVKGTEIKRDHRYVYVGERVNAMFGDDMTGSQIMSLDPNLVKKYEEVIQTGSPILDDASFVNVRNATVKFRQILLPLGKEDGTVEFIMGAMRYKIFDKEGDTPAA